MKTVPLSEAKAKFHEIAGNLANTGKTITITRRGVPVVVLMGLNEYKGILEEIERLSKKES